MNIISAIHSEKLFKSCFRDLKTWSSWICLLKALFALEMNKKEFSLYQECTGRKSAPVSECKESWIIVGRRGGKSFIAAIIALYLALFYDYQKFLGPGESGVIQIVASDRSQAGVILGYIKGILKANPIFFQYVLSELRESVELTNRISIETMTCSYRSVRGRTVVCGIFDEMSFWRTADAANPDREILAATRPSMATIPTSKLIVISSPYSQWGCVYETYKSYYGVDDPEILVWKAPTQVMNPTISQSLIDRETKKDSISARSEWYAEFREDLELFLSREMVEACCSLSGTLAPRQFHSYKSFCDPSGGRNDSFTLAVGHNESSKVICDFLKDWIPPFNPESVVKEIADILKNYRTDKIVGDRYAAEWVSSAFEKQGIRYESCEKNKSDLYLNFEGYLNTQMTELPNNPKLINELISLERRKGKAGKDSVDHPPRGSDDLANACAGLVYEGMVGAEKLIPHIRAGVDYGNLQISSG